MALWDWSLSRESRGRGAVGTSEGNGGRVLVDMVRCVSSSEGGFDAVISELARIVA